MSDRDYLDLCLLRLREALEQAALPANEQIRLLQRWDPSYAVASDLDQWCRWALGWPDLQLTDEQRSRLQSLNDRLDRMSGEENADLWTDEALRTRPEWEAVRREAGEILNHFACPIAGRLREALQEAAWPAAQQLEFLSDLQFAFAIPAYVLQWSRPALDHLELSDSQREALTALQERLSEMTDDPEGGLMAKEALRSRSEWEQMRCEAQELLDLLGWASADRNA